VSNIYQDGQAETVLVSCLGQDRADYVVITKYSVREKSDLARDDGTAARDHDPLPGGQPEASHTTTWMFHATFP